ncbi:sensor histidine kinase [Paenibacillus harenae]|uniref:sensor histidine kinase n=1 Tax=Paenibacillus harenae TaxID=306543 RepID=UPI0027915DE7|nr:sensor histidine kinase [Paenibacillus harenae]MDQ0062249.1 two-component system sensor histidine kinase YesM [Paenibacillus harenae]
MVNRASKALTGLIEHVNRRLANKLILLFATIIILVVASLTFISYQMLQKESVASSIASTSNNLLLVNQNLEDYLNGIEQLSLPQINYDELTYAIMHESEEYASRMFVEEYLRNLYFSRKDVEAIYLYVVEQGKYYALTKENYNVTVRTAIDPNIVRLPWFQEAMDNPVNQAYQSFELADAKPGYPVDTTTSFMAYHRVLRSIASREPQAVLSFYLNSSVKDDIMKDIPFSEGQHLMFLSPGDHVPFAMDDPSFYNRMKLDGVLERLDEQRSGRLTWSEGDRKYLVVYNTGEQDGWQLVKPIPYRQIYAAATTTRNLNFLIGFMFLLLALILVTFFSNAITRPLKKLSYQMNRFSKGDFEAETEVVGKDELAYLSRHFNLMVRRTNELINERYKMKLVEKNAILKALEAEINPHFLYNALQAISTKALKSERYDIADMIDALALTLRYAISGRDIVRAREELQHIERYMALQKARFGSRLQVVYDWDESLMELEIPKLSIQTLVENAIKHALEKVSSTVTIRIGARADAEHSVISVHDDGPGFTQERLEQVRESFRKEWDERQGDNAGDGIGLVNLNTRLKLLYGEEAELVIRTDNAGTEMQMLLPRGGGSYV